MTEYNFKKIKKNCLKKSEFRIKMPKKMRFKTLPMAFHWQQRAENKTKSDIMYSVNSVD